MHIGNLITRHAAYHPNRLAVVCDGQRLTYAQFNRRINRLAHAMSALGVTQGTRVATLLPNCIELLEIYWAAAKLGAIAIPLSPMLLGPALINLLRDAEASVLFTNNASRPLLNDIAVEAMGMHCILTDGSALDYFDYTTLTNAAPDCEPSHVALHGSDLCHIIYTSGTTGQPKGIVITHRVRAYYALSMAGAFRMDTESIVLHSGSIVFNGAFTTLLACAYVGGTYILHRRFDVHAFMETVRDEKVTHTMMAPPQIVAMLASSDFNTADMQSLKMILSLGAPLHGEYKKQLNQILPHRFYEVYGLTEGFFTILDRDDAVRKQGSVGIPLPFSEMRIVNDRGAFAAPRELGEIIGRSPALMAGYFRRADLTRQTIVDGWLHTGDLGYIDEDGYLYLVDRKKDMIDSGGINVYPRDIEEIAARHPMIQEVAVFGVPHEKWGEAPLAAVVLKHGAQAIDSEHLKEWINSRVAACYQRVHDVVIMSEFPRSTVGKTLKRELREAYRAGCSN